MSFAYTSHVLEYSWGMSAFHSYVLKSIVYESKIKQQQQKLLSQKKKKKKDTDGILNWYGITFCKINSF